jgi:hypothetical protein
MAQDESMEKPNGLEGTSLRVLQGVILGLVLAIPVALWAYTQTQASPDPAEPPVMAGGAASATKPVKKAPVAVTVSKKHATTVSAKEVETIPASQMHVRIDTGARSAEQSPAVPITAIRAQGNDEEEQY